MRTVFLGSPPFATPILEHLLESVHRPVLVVTPPARPKGRGRRVESSPVADAALAAEVPLLQPESVKDQAFLDELQEVEADVFLVVSYGELLRQSFLDLPRDVCLNVHPSLLPRWRGATPVQSAVLAGDETTGVSIQKVVLALDAGDVLASCETRILPGETSGELFDRLATMSGKLCVLALDAVAAGDAKYIPQDTDKVTVCKKLAKEHGLIDWTRSATELEQHVRGMNPWPLAYTHLGDAKLAVHRVQLLPVVGGAAAADGTPRTTGAPGTVLSASDRLIVACGEGALEVLILQAAGKRAMAARDWLRGARLEAGTRLGGSGEVVA